jgi:hypothetical protein
MCAASCGYRKPVRDRAALPSREPIHGNEFLLCNDKGSIVSRVRD